MRLFWQLIVLCTIVMWADSALAQRRPIADDTLGNERSIVIPQENLRGQPGYRIQGGARRGNNLFHSFREFGIETGQAVYFDDPGVRNILSRVTGSNASEIYGRLGVLGRANLFLLNPKGIVFGPDASLDIRGAFVGTTADAIQFGDQGFFSASDPSAPPLLTVQPSAFLFNQLNPAPIENSSIAFAGRSPSRAIVLGLRVPDGQSLLLVGGDIIIDGEELGGRLNAFGGRVELGSVAGMGKVGLNADGSLSFPDGIARADVLIADGSRIDVASNNGGDITINARNIDILDGSLLRAGIFSGLGTVDSQAGDIVFNGTGEIQVGQSSLIINNVETNGTGNSGNIEVTAGSLFVTDNVQLQTLTRGQGDAGNVLITATDRVVLDDSNIFSSVGDVSFDGVAVGEGGNVEINTGSLEVINGAQIAAATFGQGDAGNVLITATDRVVLDGTGANGFPSAAFSSVGAANFDEVAVGEGGNVEINTGSLEVINGAQIEASTLGRGDAGDVLIIATDRVVLDDSSIFSSVGAANFDEVAVGGGGNIRIDTNSLVVRNGAALSASTQGQGRAGRVIIDAETVSIEGVGNDGRSSGLFTLTSTEANGRGGDITVRADTIRLTDGAVVNAQTFNDFRGGDITLDADIFEATGGGQIVTTTLGGGRAGNINLNVTDRMTLSGFDPNYADRRSEFGNRVGNQGAASGLFANTRPDSSGRGGTIRIRTGELDVFDRARVVVNSQGSGVAGDININAQSIQLNQGRLTAETDRVNGGNITLQNLDLLSLRNNSLISATAGTEQAGGNGGNIAIGSELIVAQPSENSDIRANAFTGNGGNVNITTQGIFGLEPREAETDFSDITASSEQGVQGTVEITSPDTDPRRGLTELPAVIVDASQQIAQTCPSDDNLEALGEFVVTGRGGLPPDPAEIFGGEVVLSQLSTLENNRAADPSIPPAPSSDRPSPQVSLVEAQGWVVVANGKVSLVAEVSTVEPQHSDLISVYCSRS
ncbi:S-layer family protein [Phormidium tenue FACHB-886]|nr:S-layer family protein [Phormidium tenue FACHB-886]